MEIKLTQGKVAIIDDSDYELVSQYKWYANQGYGGHWYARSYNKFGKSIKMHRLIMDVTDPKIFVDHKDHDGLNNMRSNLRKCNQSENQMNRRSAAKNSSSKFLGVSKRQLVNGVSWRVGIKVDGKMKSLGHFTNEEDAAKAYNKAAKEYFGEFASLNPIS